MPTTSRRQLLRLSGACCVAGLGSAVPWAVLAAAATTRRLVVVILRGAMDGLGAVHPYADRDYRPLRQRLALPEPGREGGVLDLDGFFGLHPALRTLAGWHREGGLVTVHAVATPYRDRSHFDGQSLLENGTAQPGQTGSGWLNRTLGLTGSAGGRTLGLFVGSARPLVLAGQQPVESVLVRKLNPAPPAFLDRVAPLYAGDDPALARAFAQGLSIRRAADAGTHGTPGNADPGGAVQALAADVGARLAEPAGMRIAVLELGGWDTHADQQGRLSASLVRLDGCLSALRTGLGDAAWAETAVAVVTEFGRTAAPNGTGGTDHGTGTVAFLAGGAVAGGRVAGRWPGLGAAQLYQGRDLAPTTDLRSLLKAALVDHLGLGAADVEGLVFPGSAAAPPLGGLFRRTA